MHQLRGYDDSPLGFVHRDISAQNVFVTYDGQVRVLNFGIAKLAGADEYTAAGLMEGKLAYVPREQLLGEQVDRRAAIHAVGATLWHAAAEVRRWNGLELRDVTQQVGLSHRRRPASRRR